MSRIGIVVDSGCDVPVEILKKYNIKVAPLRIIINGKEYDEGTISEEFFFEHLDEEVTTSLPRVEAIIDAFESLIESGTSEIITFNISSGLSGTFNLFNMVSKDFMKNHEDIRIVNINTLNISIGSGLIVYRAAQYIDEGKTLDEVAELIERDIKNSTVFFVVPTLKYLVRGGRIGKVSAMIGSLLNVKPIISVGDDGIYYTVSKTRGFKRSFKRVYEEFLRFINDRKFMAGVYISGESEMIRNIQKELKEKIEKMKNTIEVFEGKISSALTVHAGPDLLGIGVLVVE